MPGRKKGEQRKREINSKRKVHLKGNPDLENKIKKKKTSLEKSQDIRILC